MLANLEFAMHTFNRILDAAELDRRGPHQMRHTFASLLLQNGAPITYVSRQLGHKDASITLRVYAHWLPDRMNQKLVDSLDDAAPRGPQTAPTTMDAYDQDALSALDAVVSRVGIEPTTRRLRERLVAVHSYPAGVFARDFPRFGCYFVHRFPFATIR
jgi:hypothetical protein